MNHQTLRCAERYFLTKTTPVSQSSPSLLPRHQNSFIPFDLSSSRSYSNEEQQNPSRSSNRQRRSLLCSSKAANAEVINGRSVVENEEIMDAEEAALVICSCITKVLPPALTLEEGLNKIDEAIQHLKSMGPPSSSRGMYSFQLQQQQVK